MSEIVKIVRIFEDNIQRSIAPSLTFFVMLGVADAFAGVIPRAVPLDNAGHRVQWWINTIDRMTMHWALALVVLLVVLVGTSYALSALHQIFFDDRLMGCFDPWLPFPTLPQKSFIDLRKAVIARLKTDPETGLIPRWAENSKGIRENDFALYEILGGIDPTGTKHYVHRSKSIGVFFVSLMLVLGLLLWRAEGFSLILLVLIAVWYVGREAVRAQYRARAMRLYVNFLMIPEGGIDHQLREKFGPPKSTEDDGSRGAPTTEGIPDFLRKLFRSGAPKRSEDAASADGTKE